MYSGAGDEVNAVRLIEEAIEIAVRTENRHREAALHNHLADLHHRAGREPEAEDSLRRAYPPVGEWWSGTASIRRPPVFRRAVLMLKTELSLLSSLSTLVGMSAIGGRAVSVSTNRQCGVTRIPVEIVC